MQGWYVGAEVVILLVLLLVLPLVTLALRRRWLSRAGGTFECSLRLGTATDGGGWALGVARYNEERLEWFRFFSYAVGPRQTFLRSEVAVLHDRAPEPVEADALYAGQRIVRVTGQSESGSQEWELAMSAESLTGLLSWLEAAPPGVVGH